MDYHEQANSKMTSNANSAQLKEENSPYKIPKETEQVSERHSCLAERLCASWIMIHLRPIKLLVPQPGQDSEATDGASCAFNLFGQRKRKANTQGRSGHESVLKFAAARASFVLFRLSDPS